MEFENYVENQLLQIAGKYSKTGIPSSFSGSAMRDLGIDSLNWLTLILDVESEFGIEFTDEIFLEEDFSDLFVLKEIAIKLLREKEQRGI